MSLQSRQQSLIEDLNIIHDPHERLAALGGRASATKLAPEQQVDENLVPGCVSRVWLHGTLDQGLAVFRCEADSPMVKGLVALLCELYSGATPAEVHAVEPQVWDGCGFTKMLSPTRLNGLASVRKRIRETAAAWLADGGVPV